MGRERGGGGKMAWGVGLVILIVFVGIAVPSQMVQMSSRKDGKLTNELRELQHQIIDLRKQFNEEVKKNKKQQQQQQQQQQKKPTKQDDNEKEDDEEKPVPVTKEPSSVKEDKKSSEGGFIEEDPNLRQSQDPVVKDIDCPALAPAVHMEIPLEHLPRKKRTTVAQKYDRRAVNCLKHGLWSSVSKGDHYKIMKGIADLIDLKKNDVVFDWGSGCGHKLHWFTKEYNTSGVGVDLSFKTLQYAWENTTKANKYCYGDGSLLDWIPSNTFDSVFSFGAIFHVYNETLMCRSYREMVRIAKKGAKIFNGWSSEDEFPNIAVCNFQFVLVFLLFFFPYFFFYVYFFFFF